MKKTIAMLILAALIFSANGGYIVFKVQQRQIHKDIKRRLKSGVPHDELHSFSFSEKEWLQLTWTKKGKEFRLKGEMYDVVHHRKANGKHIVSCINDREETVLFTRLDEMVKKEMTEGDAARSPVRKALKSIVSLIYMPPSDKENSCFVLYRPIIRRTLHPIYSSPDLKTLSPPPKTV